MAGHEQSKYMVTTNLESVFTVKKMQLDHLQTVI